jgi:DMSO/TMAO reductase YedYZ heme-binding membrane subunit
VDPQEQAQQISRVMLAMMPVFLLIGFAMMAFFVFLFWRIFTKAGLAGPLALIVLFPGIGPLIVLCILAFSEWKVIPAPQQYAYPPPQYPPAAYQPPPPPPAA